MYALPEHAKGRTRGRTATGVAVQQTSAIDNSYYTLPTDVYALPASTSPATGGDDNYHDNTFRASHNDYSSYAALPQAGTGAVAGPVVLPARAAAQDYSSYSLAVQPVPPTYATYALPATVTPTTRGPLRSSRSPACASGGGSAGAVVVPVVAYAGDSTGDVEKAGASRPRTKTSTSTSISNASAGAPTGAGPAYVEATVYTGEAKLQKRSQLSPGLSARVGVGIARADRNRKQSVYNGFGDEHAPASNSGSPGAGAGVRAGGSSSITRAMDRKPSVYNGFDVNEQEEHHSTHRHAHQPLDSVGLLRVGGCS